MINPQWFELRMSRPNLHDPIDVRVTEVRLYVKINRRQKPQCLYKMKGSCSCSNNKDI